MNLIRAATVLLILSVSGATGFADQYFFRYNHAPIGSTSGGHSGTDDDSISPPGGSPNVDPLVASGTPPAPVWVGQNVLYGFSATGGTPPYSWSASGGLPPGLSFDTDGTLFGTPSAAGRGNSYSGITVTVADAQSQQHTIGPFTIDVAPILSVSGTWPTICYVGDSCSSTFTTSGGYGALTWSLENAAGATASGSGATRSVTWTPTDTGFFTDIRVSVQDSLGQEASVGPFSAQVLAKPTASGSFPATCYVGQECNATFTASGGDGDYTWSIASAPAGMSVGSSGVSTTASWTPSTTGMYSGFSVVVTDGNGVQHSVGPFSVQVEDAPEPMIAGEFPEYCSVGTTCSATFSIVGDTQPYQWNIQDWLGGFDGTLTVNGNEATVFWTPTSRRKGMTYIVAAPLSGSGSLSKVINYSSKKDVTISGAEGEILCVKSEPCEATFTVTGGVEPYQWNVEATVVGTTTQPTVIQNGNQVTIIWDNPGQSLMKTMIGQVTAIDADGNSQSAYFGMKAQ